MRLENSIFNVKLFLTHFEIEWEKELKSLDIRVAMSKQLLSGNRLRPLLFCWGYMLSTFGTNEFNYKQISRLAIPFELIHKASIITDDIVDNDDLRNSLPTFHKEHSTNEGIVLSEFLIIHAINLINANVQKELLDSVVLVKTINVISSMTKGCLDELLLEKDNRIFDLDSIHRILDMETTSLISHSLLLGFIANSPNESVIEYAIYKLGTIYGHIFQVLNDLEPFSDNNYIYEHKGRLNFDVTKKNIVMALLYRNANRKEKKILNEIKDTKDYYLKIKALLTKHKIKEYILSDIEMLKVKADKHLQELKKYNSKWAFEFEKFLLVLVEYSVNKV